MSTQTTHADQRRFNEHYITAGEIARRLNVARTTVMEARLRGYLPFPIQVHNTLFIWERSRVEEYLCAWKKVLDAKRGSNGK